MSEPTANLIKKELGIEKAKLSEEDKEKGTFFNLSFEQVVKVAKLKQKELQQDLKSVVKQVVGCCQSMQGVRIENKTPKEILEELEQGKFDEELKD